MVVQASRDAMISHVKVNLTCDRLRSTREISMSKSRSTTYRLPDVQYVPAPDLSTSLGISVLSIVAGPATSWVPPYNLGT